MLISDNCSADVECTTMAGNDMDGSHKPCWDKTPRNFLKKKPKWIYCVILLEWCTKSGKTLALRGQHSGHPWRVVTGRGILGKEGARKCSFLIWGLVPSEKSRSAVRWLLVNFTLCVYFDNKEIKWVKKLCFWNWDKQNIVFSYNNGARLTLLPCSVPIAFNRGCSKQGDKAREILPVS